jgi:flagellar basal-body rod protein FlgG
MVRGFYQLASGMMTQNKTLNSIGNNITNVKTQGYKKQTVVSTTFGEMLLQRVDEKITPVGTMALGRTTGDTVTIHTQGVMESTGRNLDFAIQGAGFFAVQGQNGLVYTRKGDFNIDADGYLVQQGAGRVMGKKGPIMVGTDHFTADERGNIYVGNRLIDGLAVYNFADYNTLTEANSGFYTASGGGQLINANIQWQTLEGSNVDVAEEMTNAIATQRELQSCSQALKMYDKVLEKATTQIGQV